MYDTGDLLPVDEIPDGSVLLCAGPPMVGKRELVLALLAQGVDAGDSAVVLSTDDGPAEVQRDWQSFLRSESGDGTLGIVDASGTQSGEAGEYVRTVGSPTDLTGIGIEFSNLLEQMATPNRIRIGLLSLSTLLLYSDPGRVLRFLHVAGQRIREIGGVAFVMVHDDGLDSEVRSQIQAFVDGSIDVREQDGNREYRIRGLGAEAEEWAPMPDLQQAIDTQQSAVAEEVAPSTENTPSIGSIREILDAVTADSPTVTIVNHTGDEASRESIESYFDRLNVAVRTTQMDLSTPTDVALLHRDEDLLASTSVPDLQAAIDIQEDDAQREITAQTTNLMETIDQTTFGASGATKRFLIQVSHTIEMLATRVGRGRIHAGFQELSRLWEDDRARRIYQRIADRGVDVHVYGVGDVEIPDTDWTVHTESSGELTETWFVGFTAPGAPRSGVLVAEEQADGYDSFWSYREDLAEQLDLYLNATY